MQHLIYCFQVTIFLNVKSLLCAHHLKSLRHALMRFVLLSITEGANSWCVFTALKVCTHRLLLGLPVLFGRNILIYIFFNKLTGSDYVKL